MTTTPRNPWVLARRAHKMNPSVIREILKVTERPGIISFAGGLPSPKTFPVAAFAEACDKVLREDAHAALQYAASEGFAALREMVAANLPWEVDPAQVLIKDRKHILQRQLITHHRHLLGPRTVRSQEASR